MKNSINNNVKNVPSIHTGCSMAETGYNDYDDYDNPLKALDIIPKDIPSPLMELKVVHKGGDEEIEDTTLVMPEGATPASIRKEFVKTLIVPKGVHPITLLKKEDITNAWTFIHEDVIRAMRSLPYKFHQETVAYGELFRLIDGETISLQKVKYFWDWRVLLDWQMDGEKILRNETPEYIIELVMEK